MKKGDDLFCSFSFYLFARCREWSSTIDEINLEELFQLLLVAFISLDRLLHQRQQENRVGLADVLTRD